MRERAPSSFLYADDLSGSRVKRCSRQPIPSNRPVGLEDHQMGFLQGDSFFAISVGFVWNAKFFSLASSRAERRPGHARRTIVNTPASDRGVLVYTGGVWETKLEILTGKTTIYNPQTLYLSTKR